MSTSALLLVHGYPLDHTLWDLVQPLLDTSTRVLAPDLRGFGGPPVGSDEPSIERMAEDLNRQLEAERIDQAIVAGMSMGGYVALAFAERFPNRLSALALISSQAAADTEEARSGRRAMIERVRREGVTVAIQAAVSKMFGGTNTNRSDLVPYPTRGGERAGVAGITWALEAMARRPDRTAIWKALRVPTLVLHGIEDKFIPPRRARELAALASDSEYVEVPNVGHATPLEAPDRVADALNRLVRRSLRQAGTGR